MKQTAACHRTNGCYMDDTLSPVRLSAIIPTWNEAVNIAGTVAAIRSAGFDEIVVVDGGSQDETVAMAEATGADHIIVSAPGRGHQQNRGAEVATGDVFCFLHADCVPHIDSGRRLRQEFADLSVSAACFIQQIDAEGWAYRLLEWGNLCRVLWWGSAYGDQGLCIRRKVFERLGGFPEWRLMEDVELCRRLRGQGRFRVLDVPLKVSARRWQKRGIIRQTLINWTLLTLFHLGVPPDDLARFYQHIR